MTRVLLIGCDGQVGKTLEGMLPDSYQVVTTSRQKADKSNHFQLDLCDELSLRHLLREIRPELVINAAAYTAVDKAEEERDLAMAVNCQALSIMTEELSSQGSFLIHYSTDYVYDGSGDQARTEDEPTAPLNFYGHSKLAGEEVLRNSTLAHVVFRTSWVFSEYGHNFLKTMLRLGAERELLKVVADQIGSPTSARLIAQVSLKALDHWQQNDQTFPNQLYHLSCDGLTSWHGFAQEIFHQAKDLGFPLKVRELLPIPSSEFPTPAKRPLNSRLNCSRLKTDLGLSMEPWQAEVQQSLKKILGNYQKSGI